MVAANTQVSSAHEAILAGQAHAVPAMADTARMSAVLAGARARGVADAFDVLGIAAVLIDAEGAALHINRQAAACMGSHLGICARQLVTASFDSNAALQQALDCVLAGGSATSLRIVSDSVGGDTILHFFALLQAMDDPYQMLKAVIVLEQATANCGELALAARILRKGAGLH